MWKSCIIQTFITIIQWYRVICYITNSQVLIWPNICTIYVISYDTYIDIVTYYAYYIENVLNICMYWWIYFISGIIFSRSHLELRLYRAETQRQRRCRQNGPKMLLLGTWTKTYNGAIRERVQLYLPPTLLGSWQQEVHVSKVGQQYDEQNWQLYGPRQESPLYKMSKESLELWY
mgnify:CR=1 FL=1